VPDCLSGSPARGNGVFAPDSNLGCGHGMAPTRRGWPSPAPFVDYLKAVPNTRWRPSRPALNTAGVDDRPLPSPTGPGNFTRLPNSLLQLPPAGIDVFALDSTLSPPLPGQGSVRGGPKAAGLLAERAELPPAEGERLKPSAWNCCLRCRTRRAIALMISL